MRNLYFSLALAFIFAGQTWAQTVTTMYVHSAQVALKSEPKMTASDLLVLKRGDVLTVVATKELWMQVEAKGKKGWVSKLFLSKNKPVGDADFLRDANGASIARSKYRRSSPYSITAATRGFGAGMKAGADIEKQYRASQDALEQIEKITIGKKELEQFQRAGGLSSGL